MEIEGSYDGSDAQRIVAINSNKRKNRERFELLHEVFTDSIEIDHAIGVWCRTLAIAIPLVMATIGIRTQAIAHLSMDLWLKLVCAGMVVHMVSGMLASCAWGKHMHGNKLAYRAKELLLAHNEIIDAVYSLEKLSDRVDQLEANPVMAVITVDPHNNLRLKRLIDIYDMHLFATSTRLRWFGMASGDKEREFLVDDTINSSKTYLIQLLRSRPWLNQYIQLVRY